jgi:hypothetical protein
MLPAICWKLGRRGAELGQEVDVAAGGDAAVQVAREHALFLLLGHRPFVEVGALVGLEALTVVGLHQAHAELVEPVALARLLGIEDRRAGHVEVGFVQGHGSGSFRHGGSFFGPVQAHRVVDQQLALQFGGGGDVRE